MTNELRLLNVVAFDGAGAAVIQPLKRWKVALNQRSASLEIKCNGYAKVYDLRSQVMAVGIGESNKKVAIGKTLGRVALTGLFHGRQAAGADLRWGGIDRDEYREVFLVLNDTTTVATQMDGDAFESLAKMLPDAAQEEDAQERVGKLMDRIKAMVADGERVLAEVSEKHARLQAEDAALADTTDSAQTFDERHEARERRDQIGRELNALAITQRAVTYDFAVIRATKALKDKNDGITVSTVPAPPSWNLSAPMTESPAKSGVATAAPPTTKRKTSFIGKVVKLMVWLLGAFAGFVFNIYVGLLLQSPNAWFLLILTLPVGGWLALKMLAALVRR